MRPNCAVLIWACLHSGYHKSSRGRRSRQIGSALDPSDEGSREVTTVGCEKGSA
jgi:hypothetical protein